MGNNLRTQIKINYEDMQYIIKNTNNFLLINTLPIEEQKCLIIKTLNINNEENIINNYLKQGKKDVNIIIYGRNCNDEKINIKYNQLISLGFYNIYIYTGGLFEWLLLQDVYSENEFPTTNKENDILKYKPNKIIDVKYLKY